MTKENSIMRNLKIIKDSIPEDFDDVIEWHQFKDKDLRILSQIISTKCNNENITLMPVSAYTCNYNITSVISATCDDKYLGSVSGYRIAGEIQLHPIGVDILSKEYAFEGNFRGYSMGINRCKGIELRRQYARSLKLDDLIDKIYKYDLWKRQQDAILEIQYYILDRWIKYGSEIMDCDPVSDKRDRLDNVVSYFVSHKNSSIRTGVKYGSFLVYEEGSKLVRDKTRDFVKRVFSYIHKGVKRLREWMSKWWHRLKEGILIPCIKYVQCLLGQRMRTGELEIEKGISKTLMREKIYRTRWVIGIIIISHFWIVMSETEVIEVETYAMKILGKYALFKVISPMIEGGNIWKMLPELIKKYGKGYIVDGVGWEYFSGNLLKPIGCIFVGFIVLGSGMSMTTIVSIAALMLVLSWACSIGEESIEVASLFGDNAILFGDKLKDITGMLETDGRDNEYQIYLGISLVLDKVLGFKCCRDSAEAAIGSNLSRVVGITHLDKVDLNRRIATYVMYGYCSHILDALTLMSGIGDIPGYRGGGRLEEYVVEAVKMLPDNKRSELIEFDKMNLNKYWNEKYTII